MVSPEMAVKMLKRKKKWAKETWTKELRPLYIEDNIGVEMVIRVKAFMKNHRKKGEKMNENELMSSLPVPKAVAKMAIRV